MEKPEVANYENNLISFRVSVSCRGKSMYVPTLLPLFFALFLIANDLVIQDLVILI